jgi:DNA adenine methylase
MKTPVSYYGGKQRLVPEILPLIPTHTQYVEPFCGGAAVFWAKKPSAHEVINDLDGRVVNFYRVLQTRFDELQTMIRGTLHSEAEHRWAKSVLADVDADEVDRAWAFWVRCNMSFGSALEHGFAFNNNGALPAKTARNKERFTAAYAERLSKAEVFCRDAISLIQLKDGADVFFYIDPPYVSSDCDHYKGYTSADFQRLLDTLAGIRGKFLLSSYPEKELLAMRAVHGWQVKDIEAQVAVSGKRDGKKMKTECLTWNYHLHEEPIGLFATQHLTATSHASN